MTRFNGRLLHKTICIVEILLTSKFQKDCKRLARTLGLGYEQIHIEQFETAIKMKNARRQI